METIKTVTVVQHHRVDAPRLYRPNAAKDFATVLADLTTMLDDGRLYERDLPALTPAITDLVEAFNRRQQATRPSLR